MKQFVCLAAMIVLAAPAFAQGDVANGEAQFGRQCVACHVVRDDAGDVLAGRAAKAGPNLYAIAGRAVGTVGDFRYGDSIVAAGAAGAVWDEVNFVAYVQDPTDWLRTTLEDRRARSKMGYKVRSEQEAMDIYAYLTSLAN